LSQIVMQIDLQDMHQKVVTEVSECHHKLLVRSKKPAS
jgi:hypothetical protein